MHHPREADLPVSTAEHLAQLRDIGLTVIPNVYGREDCNVYIARCGRLVEGSGADTQNIWNFFRRDPELLPLVTNPLMDEILTEVMGEDYTLTAANIINRQKLGSSQANYAADWHTDSRYVGDERLDKGFCYSVLIMLDDFGADNGATHYIPGTHKRRDKPCRHGEYGHQVLTGEAGTMVIFDSGVWHRGGPSSTKSRWGVFSLYSPWYVKPYWNYPEMMGEEWGKQASPLMRRLLHYTSQPPRDETVRINTLVK